MRDVKESTFNAGPCLWRGASWRARAGRVRIEAFLNILRVS
jgi:hypothetical protein